MSLRIFLVLINFLSSEASISCRDRSTHVRQDGGTCFEIPPWQHEPVELNDHLAKLKAQLSHELNDRRQMQALVNSDISRAMDTLLAPFLDTYHRNIQNSYHQMTTKIVTRNKEEINNAVQKKHDIYNKLMNLANDLKVPPMCDEERRYARTLANKHIADQYACTERARASIIKMGKYAEEMILITKNHMQSVLKSATKDLTRQDNGLKTTNVSAIIHQLSRAAVTLGYELDLSLTNARRHNEQSCERLTACSVTVKKQTDKAVEELSELLYQCVYA